MHFRTSLSVLEQRSCYAKMHKEATFLLHLGCKLAAYLTTINIVAKLDNFLGTEKRKVFASLKQKRGRRNLNLLRLFWVQKNCKPDVSKAGISSIFSVQLNTKRGEEIVQIKSARGTMGLLF